MFLNGYILKKLAKLYESVKMSSTPEEYIVIKTEISHRDYHRSRKSSPTTVVGYCNTLDEVKQLIIDDGKFIEELTNIYGYLEIIYHYGDEFIPKFKDVLSEYYTPYEIEDLEHVIRYVTAEKMPSTSHMDMLYIMVNKISYKFIERITYADLAKLASYELYEDGISCYFNITKDKPQSLILEYTYFPINPL